MPHSLFMVQSFAMSVFRYDHRSQKNYISPAGGDRTSDISSSKFFLGVRATSAALVFVLFVFIVNPSWVSGKEDDQPIDFNPKSPVSSWHIQADDISFDKDTEQYLGKGNVSITRNGTKLTADFVRFDQKTMKVFAIGNVMMTAGEDTLTGNRMEMDLESETGTIYDGSVFFKRNHFYIKGEKIKKVGKKSYTAQKASISTCDGDNPAWKLTGRNAKVTLQGYGTITNAVMWTKNIPVFYSPFMVFPVKLRRQSGLLTPQFTLSDRKGTEFAQPYFWAINESSDATFYLNHMELRGEKMGLEYRYILSDRSQGTLMFDFLDDRKVDDGTGDSSSKWGFEDDRFLRPNHDRYWFRSKHDQVLPFDFTAKLDLDIVSDQDYLHEFRTGYTGFERTKDYFEQNFGRGIDDYDDSTRLNRLNFERRWEKSSLNTDFRWYDNVIHRTLTPEKPDKTLQRLPFIGFDVSKNQLFDTPFYFEMDSGYNHFYREEGLRGHRIDLHPRFSLPFSVKNYFTLEPSVGLRETVYQIDEFEDKDTEKDETRNREIYDINVNLSTEIYNIFSIKGKGIDKLKHSIRPQVSYSFIPEKDQDDLPRFDRLDRIGKKNILSYSIINTFTSRSPEPTEKEDGTTDYSYREFLRFKLRQSYDINEANDKDKEEKKPFSDIKAELDFEPLKYLYIKADTRWSPYESDLLSSRVDLTLSDKRGDELFLRHRYTRDSSEDRKDGNKSIYAKLLFNLTNRISTLFEYERNLYEDEDILKGFGLLYKAQCWSVDFRYTDRADDQTYSISINLLGLGGFSTSYTEEAEAP